MKKKLALLIAITLIFASLSTGGLHAAGRFTETELNFKSEDTVYNYSEGLARITIDGKNGYLDKNGKLVIDCKYDEAMDFSDGLACVGISDPSGKTNDWGQVVKLYGFIDKKGNTVIDFKYDKALSFSEGIAPVYTGEEVEYYVNDTFNGLGKIKFDKWYYINKKEEVVLENIIDAKSFHDGLALATKLFDSGKEEKGNVIYNTEKVYINKKGSVVIRQRDIENQIKKELSLDFIAAIEFRAFAGGYASFVVWTNEILPNDYAGFIDKSGKVVLLKQCSGISGFYSDMAWYNAMDENGSKLVFIDKKFNEKFTLDSNNMTFLYDFEGDYMSINEGTFGTPSAKAYIIDKNGNKVHGGYDSLINMYEGRSIVFKNDKVYLLKDTTYKEKIVKVPNPYFNDVFEKDWFNSAVTYVVDNKIMDGVGGKKFDPQTKITKAMLSTMLFRISKEEAVESQNINDIKSGKWYTDGANWVIKNNIAMTSEETQFMPAHNLTREEFVNMIYNYAKYKNIEIKNKASLSQFTDLEDLDTVYRDAFEWAVGNGIITGTSKTELSPKITSNRAMMAVIIMRFIENTK